MTGSRIAAALLSAALAVPAFGQAPRDRAASLALKGALVHTAAGAPIENAVIARVRNRRRVHRSAVISNRTR